MKLKDKILIESLKLESLCEEVAQSYIALTAHEGDLRLNHVSSMEWYGDTKETLELAVATLQDASEMMKRLEESL